MQPKFVKFINVQLDSIATQRAQRISLVGCLWKVTTDTYLSKAVSCAFRKQAMSAVSHRRQCLLCNTTSTGCCLTQQTMSAVSQRIQTLAWHATDNVCCVTRQTLFAMWHNRRWPL